MMAFTVRKCLQLDVFRNVKLVAGVRGLNRVVQFANIALTADVVSWMKGGEFLITGGSFLRESEQIRRQLIYDLNAKGVAALGLHLDKFFDQAPEDMKICADEVGLPLLELPADIPNINIMLPIFETVINSQFSVLKRMENIRRELLDAVLAGKGIDGISAALGKMISRTVLVINDHGNLLTNSNFIDGQETNLDEHVRYLQEVCRKNLKKHFLPLKPHVAQHVTVATAEVPLYLIVIPVEVSHTVGAYLVIEERNELLSEQDFIALESVSTLFTVELLMSRVSFEKEKQVRGELLDHLIFGNLANVDAAIRWAGNLNFDLSQESIVFYVAVDSFEAHLLQDGVGGDDYLDIFKGVVYQAVERCFTGYPGSLLTSVKRNCLIGLLNFDSGDPGMEKLLRQRFARLLQQLNDKLKNKLTISIGVGRAFQGVGDVRASYADARSAFRIGYLLNGAQSLSYFDELGAYVVLNELKNSSLAANFADSHLTKIAEYDQNNHGELYRTLEEYFKANCNLKDTAAALFIHKNSLIYRIKQIERITGFDLKNSTDRFDLEMSIKMAQISKNQTVL